MRQVYKILVGAGVLASHFIFGSLAQATLRWSTGAEEPLGLTTNLGLVENVTRILENISRRQTAERYIVECDLSVRSLERDLERSRAPRVDCNLGQGNPNLHRLYQAITFFPHLRNLNLRGNYFSHKKKRNWQGLLSYLVNDLRELETLDLSGPELIGGLAEGDKIDYNFFKDEGKQNVVGTLPSVQTLMFENTCITAIEDVKRLSTSFPNVEVLHIGVWPLVERKSGRNRFQDVEAVARMFREHFPNLQEFRDWQSEEIHRFP